ncbi:MAG: PIN domain-containing protein [Bacillus sp. (in: Bacteria)]|nr:PIN domain-containing protein [Bacillus sp. (in: firmicutes)]MCM1425263.1 PIN domain-containing protein [Eubacterium sp.]
MVVLIDTNVILNYITEREDRFRESSKIVMDLCSQEKVNGYIAFHSLSIIWYSLRIPEERKRMWLKDICSILTVAGASHEQVLEAIDNAQFKDFEDCLQDECAQMVKADCLVTCNLKDFTMAKTKVYSPDEFVALLK